MRSTVFKNAANSKQHHRALGKQDETTNMEPIYFQTAGDTTEVFVLPPWICASFQMT